MNAQEVRERAFAMPLTQPAYPPGPYRFVNREYLTITYRTDADKLRAVVPEPLEIDTPLVKFEFIRMPDSTGFGDYTEAGQVIPVSFRGRKGGYTHGMFLNDHPPIAAGRELWGFPKKLAQPNYLLKIIPHVDGTPRICELVEYSLDDIRIKGVWTRPGALSLNPHALAPVAELPVHEVLSAMHLVCDVTPPLGKVIHDYLA